MARAKRVTHRDLRMTTKKQATKSVISAPVVGIALVTSGC